MNTCRNFNSTSRVMIQCCCTLYLSPYLHYLSVLLCTGIDLCFYLLLTQTQISVNAVNSSLPSAAYMRQWIGSALVQIMGCRLFGAEPLSNPVLVYCQFDPWEQISVKFWSCCKTFHSQKCIWKCCLRKKMPFCPGGDELKKCYSLKTKK